ncbi:ATP-dependent 6-phosphofructokinase [Acidilobus saccharovorans 345-15]|uniref:ATP-dependent 6-phosphofructokinase n=1 Tax=Acidilobus saccharovorans (strain DSM 16705 / JCM 18335 / VKM B-2471 / 345-15) TaxID=666510 RepID=D9PZF0_ACIS3|nr:carbohydrate kinase family protein [Acidilobus saccharovorans]ADL18438.1 ATP-dependent 6-phosphofructokinase [Acidilobus saccharovorans 345-15]
MEQKDLDVVAIGHALVDLRFTVSKFASPDEEADIEEQSTGPGGSAINVALITSRLGGKAAVITKIGLDNFGRQIVEELVRSKVDISGLKVGFGSTGFSVLMIDKEGNIVLYGYKGCAEKLDPDEIDEKVIARGKFVHIASLRPDTSLRAAVRAKELDAMVSWDPGRRLSMAGLKALRGLIKFVDIVELNSRECANLTGIRDPVACAEEIQRVGPSTVIVKMGPRGLYALSDDFTGYVPAFKVSVVRDSTGSGDTFAAAMLLRLSRGDKLRDALVYAQAVAALKVTMLGANALPPIEEIEKFYQEHRKEVEAGIADKPPAE